jgi:YggT family protein
MFLVVTLVSDALQLLTLLIIVRAVLSWIPSVDYGHPLIGAIMRVTDPVLLPLRRVIPPLGGLDLSPIVAILLVQLAGQLLIRMLFAIAAGT